MQRTSHFISADRPQIDIHCHREGTVADHLQILSLDCHELAVNCDGGMGLPGQSLEYRKSLPLPIDHYFSLGIHPWFIERQDIAMALQILDLAGGNANLLAIGECGLDKCINTPLNQQIEVFTRQIELAERLGKPLIIHCVKAFNELMQIKKARKAASVWIVHGFNANPVLAAQLIKQGCYLSFGAALMDPRSLARQALVETPLDRLFFETDTAELPISEIYATAAKMLDFDAATLRQQILCNFNRVFFND